MVSCEVLHSRGGENDTSKYGPISVGGVIEIQTAITKDCGSEIICKGTVR